jgi:Ser/Thr protein kinase RdoA (MazF antagonist)
MFNNPILTDVVYRLGLDAFMHVAEGRDELRDYVGALRDIRDTFLDKMREMLSGKGDGGGGLMVLNHNDFHNKNVLFKEVDGRVVDLYFVSFFFRFLKMI